MKRTIPSTPLKITAGNGTVAAPEFCGDVLATANPAMQEVLDKLRRVAPTRTTVLLLGETGVGKDTLARAIHALSNRIGAPFVTVHCGAIPESLIESELFGHEKGAFTGAIRRKPGKFELAHTGTVFLDEVGTLTPSAQVRLLGALQDRTIQRVGGDKDVEVDVRILAATNEDLRAACDRGEFRKDLFFRLNVFPLELPALRDRTEDIPLLAAAILDRLQDRAPKPIKGIAPEVIRALAGYDWPGNVRELENLLERALILETGRTLSPTSFPAELFPGQDILPSRALDTGLTLNAVRRKAVADVERAYLEELLRRNHGRIGPTALDAGISTRQLNKLMHKHGLRKDPFKTPA